MNKNFNRLNNFLIGKKFLFCFDLIFFAVHCFYLSNFIPTVVSVTPATGGDTGSHFWPVFVLREYGFPNFNLRPWSPGNFAGEPLLVHYFPFPFILMTLMSYVLPSGLAFNLGTFLPVILMPVALRWGVARFLSGSNRGALESKVAGNAAGILCWSWLLNESNSMWGGNLFSLFAGQFAHAWGFLFFALMIGVLPAALRFDMRHVLMASILFCLIILSHAYVALFVPLALLSGLVLFDNSMLSKLKSVFGIMAIGSILTLWFWLPMIDNAKWTTPYAFEWRFTDYVKELIPIQMGPQILLALLWLFLFLFSPKFLLLTWRTTTFWIIQFLGSVCGYFAFTKIGLVDVRAIPHAQLTVTVIAAIAIGSIYTHLGRLVRLLLVSLSLIFPFIQWEVVESQISTLRHWAQWNYSGWTSKEGFPSVKSLSDAIAGNFDDPRVAFEHDGGNNIAGTPRVFEMLPFFSGRSSGDGVYMQSTILAPMFFYHQATISVAPSCPFPNYGCTVPDIDRAVTLGSLLGIDTFIFKSPELIELAKKNQALRQVFFAKPWQVFSTAVHSVNYVDVPNTKPTAISSNNWRDAFWKWFTSYTPGSEFLYVNNDNFVLSEALEESFKNKSESVDCNARVDVAFDRLTLRSDCPGRFHVLKFAYHSSWRSSGGEPLYLTSPGFIGLIPKQKSTEIVFGKSVSWFLSNVISVVAASGLFIYLALRYYHLRIAPVVRR